MAIKKLPSTGDAPRSTGVPASLAAGGTADSAGFPWQGRTFDHHDTSFSSDQGDAPEEFRQAVRSLRLAAEAVDEKAYSQSEALLNLASAHSAALMALSKSRVLVPLLAEAGDFGLTPEGRTVEKSQELSIVTVAAPDGRRVMPVFTSVETMMTWSVTARPIPVPAPQVALAAAQEATDLIIVDPASPDLEFGVRRTQLEALALAQPTTPAWADQQVLNAFRNSLAGQSSVEHVELQPADPSARLITPETSVVIVLRPGLDRDEVDLLMKTAQQKWATDSTIANRVDSLRVIIR